jgi:hypothetical protein
MASSADRRKLRREMERAMEAAANAARPFVKWVPPTICLTGVGLMQVHFILGSVVAYIGLIALFLEIIFNRWFLKQPPWIQLLGLALVLVLIDAVTIGIVFRRSVSVIYATSSDGNYDENFKRTG